VETSQVAKLDGIATIWGNALAAKAHRIERRIAGYRLASIRSYSACVPMKNQTISSLVRTPTARYESVTRTDQRGGRRRGRVAGFRAATGRIRGESAGAAWKSQLIRIELFALAATIGSQNVLNEPAQLLNVGGGGLRPSLVFIQLVEQECGERILALLRRMLKSFDRLL
jgi:hypothetical protein